MKPLEKVKWIHTRAAQRPFVLILLTRSTNGVTKPKLIQNHKTRYKTDFIFWAIFWGEGGVTFLQLFELREVQVVGSGLKGVVGK